MYQNTSTQSQFCDLQNSGSESLYLYQQSQSVVNGDDQPSASAVTAYPVPLYNAGPSTATVNNNLNTGAVVSTVEAAKRTPARVIDNIDNVFETPNAVSQARSRNLLLQLDVQNPLQAYASPNESLRDFLKRDINLEMIWKQYLDNKALTSTNRSELTRILICRERDNCIRVFGLPLKEFKIKTEKLIHLASEISEIFNEKVDVYYIPHKNSNGVNSNAAGKLWNAFNNVKKSMRSNGMLIPKKNAPNELPKRIETGNAEDVLKKLMELEDNKIDPWNDVSKYWLETFTIRKDKLFFENLTVSDYMSKYACLSLNKGYELLLSDFNELYPGKTNTLQEVWRPMCSSILHLLQASRKPTSVDDQVLVRDVQELPTDGQDAVALFLLPKMIKSTQMKYGKNHKKRKTNAGVARSFAEKNRKFSTQEIQEGFILHVKNASTIDEAVEIKRNKLYEEGQRLQPVILFVGPVRKLEAIYVVVDNKKYRMKSPIDAVDVAFKIFYAVDIQYPISAYGVWLIFQKLVYKVDEEEKAGVQLDILISEIEEGMRKL